VLDPVRKPVTVAMLSFATLTGGAALAHDILDSHGPTLMSGAAVPDHHPITFTPAAPPSGGTAIDPGYHAAPPYGPVDPLPPTRIALDIRRTFPSSNPAHDTDSVRARERRAPK